MPDGPLMELSPVPETVTSLGFNPCGSSPNSTAASGPALEASSRMASASCAEELRFAATGTPERFRFDSWVVDDNANLDTEGGLRRRARANSPSEAQVTHGVLLTSCAGPVDAAPPSPQDRGNSHLELPVVVRRTRSKKSVSPKPTRWQTQSKNEIGAIAQAEENNCSESRDMVDSTSTRPSSGTSAGLEVAIAKPTPLEHAHDAQTVVRKTVKLQPLANPPRGRSKQNAPS